MAGFIVDAREATRLAADIAAKTAALKAVIDDEVAKAGRKAQATARANAPSGPHTRKFPASIGLRVTTSQSGARAVVESRSPLGSILEFGVPGKNGPLGFMKSGLDAAVPPLESALMDAGSRIIDGSP